MKNHQHRRGLARNALLWLGGFLLIGWVAAEAQAQGAYDVVDLGTLGGNTSQAFGINDSGQVVGTSEFSPGLNRAFLWQNGTMSNLGTLGGTSSEAFGINNSGQVVGRANLANGPLRAFLWQNGTMSDLGTLGSSVSEAQGINDSGQVVGISGAGATARAFLWQNGMTDLGTLGGSRSQAHGINNSGQVVGDSELASGLTHAFLWQNGVMTDLGTLGGDSVATGINDAGQVVGLSLLNSGLNRAFLWQNGVMTDLGTLGGATSQATGINDAGQVVGFSSTAASRGARAFVWQNGAMQNLNDLIDPNSGWLLLQATAINNAGEIAGLGIRNGQQRAFLLRPARRPVLIIPGIGATYPANVNDIGPWMFTRGIHPSGLQLDPLAHAYDDLIQTLKNVGYVEGKDLFVVNYDWRVTPGPSDGVFDGFVSGLSGTSVTDQTFEYAVDYLGYYLQQAMDAWETNHPGIPLDKVNIIAHSTGGLVARTYIQSAAYGGTFGNRTLPTVDHLIMIGVPNRGASKAWNTLHDNWGVDIAFQLVLSKIVNLGYQKVLAGAIITGPDIDISLSSLGLPVCPNVPEICFIHQFNPTARSLLATYDFIDFGNGFTNVNSDLAIRNNSLLDLNAGLDLALNGDPNSFADRARVTVIYATNVDTPTAVVQKVGPVGGQNAIVPFTNFAGRDALPGEIWYDDIVAPVSGDGTVPVDSSAGQFVGDPRATLKPFARGTNTSEDVSHLGLMYNSDVQGEILKTLGASFAPTDISTNLHSAFASQMSTATNIAANIIGGNILGTIFDPVEGFIVDGQGRRLGFSAATGPVAEIPGSVWFGNANGLGWVLAPLVDPLSLELSGLGDSYYTMVSVVTLTGESGLIDKGVLGFGQQLVLPIPTDTTTTNQPPVANAGPNKSLIAGETGRFDGSGSSDPDGLVVTYSWNFGDGTTGAGAIVSHRYRVPGTFTVTLTVTDDLGTTATATAQATVISLTQAIQQLKDLILSLKINQVIIKSLIAKLDNVIAALNAANAQQRQDAVKKLQAFINEVQAGKILPNTTIAQLISLARRILGVL